MFMIPMPPTIREIEATVASRRGRGCLSDLAEISYREIVRLARMNLVPVRQRFGDL
jgi:hypothetical protein